MLKDSEVKYSNYTTFRLARVKDDFGATITIGDTPSALNVTEGSLKAVLFKEWE